VCAALADDCSDRARWRTRVARERRWFPCMPHGHPRVPAEARQGMHARRP
jgi:hypothetical protein